MRPEEPLQDGSYCASPQKAKPEYRRAVPFGVVVSTPVDLRTIQTTSGAMAFDDVSAAAG